ncbi:MAG: hypothetical protein NC313_02665 [Butyrivibrio sp.]|nr:hypothetical protein [Butyrivibrio sp.]
MKLNLKYYLRGLGLGIVVTAIIMCILNAGDDEMTDEEIIARAKQLGMIEDTVLTDGLNTEKQDNGDSSGEGQDGDSSAEDQNSNGAGTQTDDNENANNGETGAEGQAGDTKPQTTTPLLPESWTGASTVEAAEAGSLLDDGNDAAQPEEGASDAEAGNVSGTGDGNGDVVQAGSQGAEDSNSGTTQAGSQGAEDSNSDTAQDNDGMAGVGTQDEPAVFPKVLIISSGEGSYTVSKKLVQIGAIESAEEFDTYLCENGYDKKIRTGTYTIPVGATNEQMAKIVTGAKISE